MEQQRLYDLIQWVALLYPAGPVGDSYVAAAGQSVFPTSVGGSPSVVVDGPKGNQTIANPLFSYQFNPLSPSDLPDSPVRIYQSFPFPCPF
jgi:tyrosinase